MFRYHPKESVPKRRRPKKLHTAMSYRTPGSKERLGANLGAKQWVDTVGHDRKWTEVEEEEVFPTKCKVLLPLGAHDSRDDAITSGEAPNELDIKRIDSSFCTHKILMEDEFKPSVQPQRRVNPNIKEVVKKEVIKLLDARLIYPISDCPWVSHVRVVLKKGGMTVMKNEKTSSSRKGRMLYTPRRANEYYCLLRWNPSISIPIAPEDQEKTTFTCPYGTFAYKRMPFGLCNAPVIFQRCMTAIFHELIKDSMEVFMDNFSVFAVLGKRIDKHFKPIHYAIKTMNEAQENYITTEKELLAVVFAFDKFCPYLVLSKTIIFTDHSALRYLFTKQDAKPRLIRWILLLQEFDIKIHDKKGVDNLAADHLSRLKNPDLGKLTKAEIRDLFPEERLMASLIRITNHEHRAYWAIKNCNIDLMKAGVNQFLQINKLDEMRLDAYESSISYKERTKRWHDKRIKAPNKLREEAK
ncbi:reverse transcriptase domain-containing protein [Tanacetum coccineum]